MAKPKPAPSATASANHRARVVKEGGRQVAVMLTPEANAKLAGWQQRGESITDCINRLLTRSKP